MVLDDTLECRRAIFIARTPAKGVRLVKDIFGVRPFVYLLFRRSQHHLLPPSYVEINERFVAFTEGLVIINVENI